MNTLSKGIAAAALALAGFAATGTARAQVAGTTSFSTAVVDVKVVALGWSAKKQVIGAKVYNDAGELVGRIDDIIISPDSAVSIAIVGVGGFIGVGRHDVAIPAQFFVLRDSTLLLPGATRDAIKALPEFKYADKRK